MGCAIGLRRALNRWLPCRRDNEPMIAKLQAKFAHLTTSRSLSARAMQSSVWVVVGFGAQRGLQFVSNLILTRLLFPEAFGIMTLATVFLVGLAMFSDIGLKPAIIRDARGVEPAFLNTAWTIQVVRGFGLFGAGCLLAYPVSLIYGQPILFPLLVALSSTAAISGFQTIGLATSERELDFFRPTVVALLGQFISVIALIALAWYWRSVWALAVGTIIGTVAAVVLGHVVLRSHRHRFMLDPASTGSIVSFGRWILLSTIVTFVGSEGLRALQAGLLSLAEFGVLSIAYTMALIATDLPTKLTGTIGLPALAEAYRSSPDRMANVLWQLRKRVLILAIPLAAIVAMASEPLIELLYDNRYHSAGRYVAVLTLSNAVTVVFSGYSTALLAMGQSKTYLISTSFMAVTRIVGISAGFEIYGTLGMLIGLGLANIANLAIFWTLPSIRPFVSKVPDTISVITAITVCGLALFA